MLLNHTGMFAEIEKKFTGRYWNEILLNFHSHTCVSYTNATFVFLLIKTIYFNLLNHTFLVSSSEIRWTCKRVGGVLIPRRISYLPWRVSNTPKILCFTILTWTSRCESRVMSDTSVFLLVLFTGSGATRYWHFPNPASVFLASAGWNTGAAARGKPATLTPSSLKRAAPRGHICGGKRTM